MTKSGKTTVVYSYNNIEKKVTVVLKESKTSIYVHNSTIYVEDEWQAEDNFDGATDRKGTEVALESIAISGDEVDTSKAIVTVKEKQTMFDKEATITFLEDKDTGTIINPDNLGEEVIPVDPLNPNDAELMITYASNLNFGVQSKQITSWPALADKVWVDKNHMTTREVTPFVAAKDLQGPERKGWALAVTQS